MKLLLVCASILVGMVISGCQLRSCPIPTHAFLAAPPAPTLPPVIWRTPKAPEAFACVNIQGAQNLLLRETLLQQQIESLEAIVRQCR